jgi:hypothetical protein
LGGVVSDSWTIRWGVWLYLVLEKQVDEVE